MRRGAPGAAPLAAAAPGAPPLAARAEKEEKRRKGGGEKALNAAVAAFLTDSQRGKIAAFARRCLDAEEERKKKGTK